MNHASFTVLQSDEAETKRLCASGTYKQIGIKGVICPALNVRVAYPEDLAALILPVFDEMNVPDEWYDHAVDFHKKFSPTLVHCWYGQNRSVMFAAALLFSDGMDLDVALQKLATVPVCNSILTSLTRWAKSKGWNGKITIPVNMNR